MVFLWIPFLVTYIIFTILSMAAVEFSLSRTGVTKRYGSKCVFSQNVFQEHVGI